ncbi:MAG: UDP-N-acetylmuramoyl-tripeptide--D-alanyl-D-alanine ligase [Thermoguttaceae bacterium]|jgi:UDP-N-acetylmuramoyl-tripeptide--D-alanyl-D-alanine ligase
METLRDLQQTVGGQLLPEGRVHDATAVPLLGRIVTDSRQVAAGDVFLALEGANHDGASFAGEAFRRGAPGAVVASPIDVPEDCWALLVDDTQLALEQWARWKRRQFTGTLIAVTGSVGKTTTRQMIDTVLRRRLRGTTSPRSSNNHLGVPCGLLALDPGDDYAVLELGASRRGEIAAMSDLCAPKVGVITPIGEGHLALSGNREAVADAKSELLAALPESGQAVLADDPCLHTLSWRCRAPITWVGSSAACGLRAIEVGSQGGRLGFCVAIGAGADGAAGNSALGSAAAGRRLRFSVPVWGRHHLTAALSAVAVGRMMGFDLAEIAAALETFQAVPMRCEVTEIRGATVINDACNSNPTAMRAALELLRDFDAPGRRIAVVGDIAEPGPQATARHWQLGKEIVRLGGTELLIACGRFARHVTAGARAAGLIRSRAIPCDTVEDALPYLGQAMLPGDVVLVKGSRMMEMERVIEALKRYPQRRTA